MQYVFGDHTLDVQRRELRCRGQGVPLQPKIFDLLLYLITHHDRAVSKQELLIQLWPNLHVSLATLSACIKLARQALGDSGATQHMIQTLHGRGYRFVASVEAREQAPPTDQAQPGLSPRLRGQRAPSLTCPLPLAEAAAAVDTSSTVLHTADGEYKPVTVLCCGLADASDLAVRLGPEAMYRLMQAVFGLAQEVMGYYEGAMTHHAHDGFTAVFGAPVAQEDHARRAALAALELHQRLRTSPALHAHTLGRGLAVCMGLHSGLVVGGDVGNRPQPLYTVVGEPTSLATHLQYRAAPGTILMSAATYRLVHEEVQVEDHTACDIGGTPAPGEVYALRGLLRRYAGVSGRRPWARSPFVGRERELALLHERLAVAVAGQGQVVSLVGEPGMGKTRLLTEFCRYLPDSQVTYYAGQCLPYGRTTPYHPVRDILRQVCAVAEGDHAETRTAAVRQRLQDMNVVAAEDVALVLRVLDLPGAPVSLASLHPQTRQARTFALLRHLILRAAQRQPLVLVVENLHWSDATSEAWLASLVERLTGTALLLLVTYRPGYQPPWGAHSTVTQLALPPLRVRDSWAIAQSILRTAQPPGTLLQEMVAKAAGNPFFLEELVWHAVEHGSPQTPVAVPETVHAVLAARIDRLPPEAKHLVQTAAVLGNTVPVVLLRAIAEIPEEALQRSLAHLQAVELLYETRAMPALTYTFKHALTQEVAYGSLLQERRRALHARLVDVLETLAADRLGEQVERLADHAFRGERWDKALTYLWQAGTKAFAHSAHREAVACFEQALRALQHLSEDGDTRALAIDLQVAMGSALQPSGAWERILALLHEAEVLTATLNDPGRLGQVYVLLSRHCYFMGAYEQSMASGQRALALATASGDVVLHALAHQRLGLAYEAQGDYHRAIDCHKQAVASLEGPRRHERFGLFFLPAVHSCARLAACHAELGAFAEGCVFGDEGLRIAAAVAHPASLMIASWGIGLLALRQGDLSRALSLLERAIGICQEADFPAFFPRMARALGAMYTLCGRIDDAVRLLTPAMEQTTTGETLAFPALCSLPLGEAHMLSGRLEEAHALAEHALALARAHQERGNQAYALRLLGDIAGRRESPEVEHAETYYRQALALTEELGMRPLQAHCHRDLGTLYATTGPREQARAELSTAIEMYRAMDMTFWLPETEAALAQVEGR